MQVPTGTVRRAVLLGAGVLLVAACADDPPAAGRVPTETSAPTSTSASPTPATPEDEVEAAVRAYYAELTRAAQTQKTAGLKASVLKSCPCFRAAEAIDRLRRQGRSTPDAQWTVEKVAVKDLKGDTAVVEVRYIVAPYDVLTSDGQVLEEYQLQSGHVDVFLVRPASGSWTVSNLFDLEA